MSSRRPHFLMLICLTLIVSVSSAYAQLTSKEIIDSALTHLPSASLDTNKVNLLNTLSWEYLLNNQYKEALDIIEQTIELSKLLNYTKGEAVASNHKGIYLQTQSDFAEAFNYYLLSLELNEEAGNQQGIAFSNQSIGVIYFIQGEFETAIEYYDKALQIYEEIGENKGIGYIYSNIANCYVEIEKYDEALENYTNALAIFMELESNGGASVQNNQIADTYMRMRRYEDALYHYKISLSFAEYEGRNNLIIGSRIGMGQVHLKLKQYDEAREEIEVAMILIDEFGSQANYRDVYKVLSTLDSVDGNWADAYQHELLHIAYRDSVMNETNTKETVEVQMKFAFDQLEAARLAEQEKKDIRDRFVRNATASGLIGALIFGVVVYRQRNKLSKEKKKSEALLLNILPKEIAEELKRSGKAEPKVFEQVTILFTDFVQFTEMAEQMSAKDLVNEIDVCFKAFDRIVRKHGVEKIKTIGDSYMAAGGLPVPSNDSTLRTLMAAFEMQNFIERRKRDRDKLGLPTFQMRAGLHTGRAVTGIVGVLKFQYDIWGDTVNVASRMEAASEAGRINVSQSTYDLLSHDRRFHFIPRGKVYAKGKGDMEMYFASMAVDDITSFMASIRRPKAVN